MIHPAYPFFQVLAQRKSYGDSSDFHDTIIESFPPIADAGGYELLWVSGPGRSLEVIPFPADRYTAAYLKDIVRQAKIYIRPIQKNLPMCLPSSSTASYIEHLGMS